MYARQAIQSKYLGPTNYRPARIKVWCDAKTRFVHWDHGHNPCENHYLATIALAKELGWNTDGCTFGALPSCGYALTFPTV